MADITEAKVDWGEIAVTTLGTFERLPADQIVEYMGIVALRQVRPLPEEWEVAANGGMAQARNGGFVQNQGQQWTLTDGGRQEADRILSFEPSD